MAIRRHWLRWVIAAAIVVVVLAVGVPFVYIHFIEGSAPAPLGLTRTPSSKPAPSSTPGQGGAASSSPAQGGTVPLAGSWRVGPGSIVGYRVKEVLVGQDNTAVGRSSAVTGHLTIAGTTVSGAVFSVPIATIHSDQSHRDAQFDGRIMDASAFPTGTFTLTHPIHLAPVPAMGQVKTYSATGNLTLHGHTRSVTFALSAERTPISLKVSGSIPITFALWSIPNPSFGSFVTTQNHGVLEFLLTLTNA